MYIPNFSRLVYVVSVYITVTLDWVLAQIFRDTFTSTVVFCVPSPIWNSGVSFMLHTAANPSPYMVEAR